MRVATALTQTPWPYDATFEAIDWTWAAVTAEGDVVSQHLEEGVPWKAAATGAPFPPSFEAGLADRRARAAGRRQLLSLNALDLGRQALAGARGDALNEPLAPPWSEYALDDPAVLDAYVAYVERVTDALQPDYLQTGIEVNLLLRNTDAATWASFVALQCHVYDALKADGYTQPISVSVVSTSFYHPELYDDGEPIDAQLGALADLEPCVDVIAWSVYPYLSGLFADSLPEDYFDTILSLTNKPQAISESGYSAQTWTLPGVGTWQATPEEQLAFTDLLLRAAQEHALRFVVWFAVRDYDALWERPAAEGGLAESELGLLWRDTGLFDEAGRPRPALGRWREALALPRE